MAQSDSEGFESADEGTHECVVESKGRKKRISSSNFSDTASDPGQDSQKDKTPSVNPTDKPSNKTENTTSDGWDDFDIDEDEPKTKNPTPPNKNHEHIIKPPKEQHDDGWDDFDDWGQEEQNTASTNKLPSQTSPTADIRSVADRLSASSSKEDKPSGGGWGWGGWGVDSFLSSATAGISTITNHVSQGITTVLETGIGAPDPEEMARMKKAQFAKIQDENPQEARSSEEAGDEGAFQLGSLLSGVTKFVETTGTKVIAGGLDTLETIGKKTMEVLQDGDPGLAKKRALFGLDSGDKPVLSQVLREAKARADEEDQIREDKREAKQVHYETLFDDFEGLVHLEALEMLSRQVSMRIEDRLRQAPEDKKQEIKETLQQVAELCEMPEDEDEDSSEAATSGDELHEKLLEAIRDLGAKLHFQALVKQYGDILTTLSSEENVTEKLVYKQAVSGLAQYTASCVEVYHKAAELLLVKTRRSTADEADALTQMTVVLTKHVSELAARFTAKLNSLDVSNKDQVNNYITNIFLEAGNSSTYIQNAFRLALPILQIGAV